MKYTVINTTTTGEIEVLSSAVDTWELAWSILFALACSGRYGKKLEIVPINQDGECDCPASKLYVIGCEK